MENSSEGKLFPATPSPFSFVFASHKQYLLHEQSQKTEIASVLAKCPESHEPQRQLEGTGSASPSSGGNPDTDKPWEAAAGAYLLGRRRGRDTSQEAGEIQNPV